MIRTDLNLQVEGEGLPVVLFNSMFQRAAGWRPVVEALSRYHKVISFEFPNQGLTTVDDDFRSMEAYARLALDLLKELGHRPEEVVPYGYSFGANVARYLARHMDVRFKALILGGVATPRIAGYHARLFRLWNDLVERGDIETFARVIASSVFSPAFVAEHPDQVDQMEIDFVRSYGNRPRAALNLIHAARSYLGQIAGRKDRFDFPVHLIGAESDLLMPINFVLEYDQEIRAVSVHNLAGGHANYLESPKTLIMALDEILENYE